MIFFLFLRFINHKSLCIYLYIYLCMCVFFGRFPILQSHATIRLRAYYGSNTLTNVFCYYRFFFVLYERYHHIFSDCVSVIAFCFFFKEEKNACRICAQLRHLYAGLWTEKSKHTQFYILKVCCNCSVEYAFE